MFKKFLILINLILFINLINCKSIVSNVIIPDQLNYNGNDIIQIQGYNLPRYLNSQLYTKFDFQFHNGTIFNFDQVQVEFSANNKSYQYELITPYGYGSGILRVSVMNETTGEDILTQVDFFYQYPYISNVSLVSPRYGGVVTVSGSGFWEATVQISVLNKPYKCANIKVNQNANQLTCELGPVLNVIDANYYQITVVSGNMLNCSFEKFTFLPFSKVCPNNCSANGYCDSQLNCICNQGYESFDCSIKVSDNQIYPKSNLTTMTSFKMSSPINTNQNNEYSISISSFRRLNPYGLVKNQYPITVLNNFQKIVDDQGFQVSGTSAIKTDMFESFEFDGNFYLNSNESPESFISEHGYNVTLPTSRNSAVINLLMTGINTMDDPYGQDLFQFVFEISLTNGKNNEIIKPNATMNLNQVITISSDQVDSILQFTPFYFSYSLSNNISNPIDRTSISSVILSDDDASTIFGYNPNSIYIAIETQPQYEMLMVDSSFNLFKSTNKSSLSNSSNLLLKVFLPIGSLLIIGIILLSIFIIKLKSSKNNNNNNYKELNQKKPLLNSDDDYEEQDIENIQSI